MTVVIENINRVNNSILSAYAEMDVATVHEAQGRTGLLKPYIRPVLEGVSIVGSALTCTVAPGDNWTIHLALEQAKPGDVLVVVPTSACDDGYFGDLLAVSCQALGVRGLVIDAGVRDVRVLRKMQFPVWSKCISAQGTVKETLGDVNVPVVCAGQIIRPGDLVLADDDGVVVVDPANAEMVLQASLNREAEEAVKRELLAKGQLSLDLFNLREKMKSRHVEYK